MHSLCFSGFGNTCPCVVFIDFELIGIVFKVIYLPNIPCSDIQGIHASCVTRQLDLVVLENLLVCKLKYFFHGYANLGLISCHAKGDKWLFCTIIK